MKKEVLILFIIGIVLIALSLLIYVITTAKLHASPPLTGEFEILFLYLTTVIWQAEFVNAGLIIGGLSLLLALWTWLTGLSGEEEKKR